MGRLDGEVAVITGAASGIGRASALRFAAEAANFVVADLSEEHGAPLATEINRTFVQVGVADGGSVTPMYAAASVAYGGISDAYVTPL
ncbi:MAG TPA: SDR family NAD(P)-dependent oxidoreductase [Acidimicrobiales bacterium]